jgi:phosphate uptake regulator
MYGMYGTFGMVGLPKLSLHCICRALERMADHMIVMCLEALRVQCMY